MWRIGGALLLFGCGLAASCTPSERGTVSEPLSASSLHEQAIVVDGHEHATNRAYFAGIDPWTAQETGLFDYARAKRGGLDVVFENVASYDEYNNYNYTVKHVCQLIETFYRVLEANRDKMDMALTSADVRRIVASGKLAAVLSIESGFDMEGDLDVLRLFHRLGVRLVQFTSHNTTNAYADAGLDEPKWNGINDHGRRLVHEMNRLGIIIDISHASDATQLQVIEASGAPVAASHHGLRRFSDNPRTLSDEVLKALAAKGGLVGLHSSAAFLSQRYSDWSKARRTRPSAAPSTDLVRPPIDHGEYMARLDALIRPRWTYTKHWRELTPPDAPVPTVEDWVDQVDYAVKLVGVDHVGIGLDMNDAGGSLKDFDATGYPRFTEALLKRGYSPDAIRKILGENWLRVLDSAKVAPAAPATP